MESNESTEFFEWKDSTDMPHGEIADKLGVDARTLSVYKSRGLPKNKRGLAKQIMREWDDRELAKSIVAIEYTGEEFDEIDAAAKLIDVSFRDFILRSSIARAREEIEKQKLSSITPVREDDVAHYLPRIAVAAGSPITADDLDDLEVGKLYSAGHFAALVNGESMQPTIKDGAHCLMLSRDHLDNPHCKKGEIYSFVVNGELTLKEFQTRLATPEEIEKGLSYTSFKTGEQKVKVLHSHNPAFKDLVVTGEDFQMTGWFIKTL